MAKNHEIKCTITAKDGATAVFNRVKASTVALGVAAGNLVSAGIVKAANAIRGMVNDVLEAEKANVMLDAALRGVGSYTPEMSRKMRDLADAIQNETGASDEQVKANIAQLTTMGVATEQMGEAARATAALASLGRDGALAMVAVARAMEGDISGFERFAPEVRNATTLTEKYAAVNKLLAAGYAQQTANLSTVGGALAALKGRLGDAVEDMGNAITAGLGLGASLNTAQDAMGKFLQSGNWQSFTDKLEKGAGYVKQIISAMGTDGGAKEVASAFGNVILAALKDGADYVKEAITSGFGNTGGMGKVTKGIFDGWWKPGTMPMDRAAGNVLGNMIEGGLWGGGKKQSNLDKALKQLNSIVVERVEIAQSTKTIEQAILKTTEETKKPLIDIAKAKEKQAEKERKAAEKQTEINDWKGKIAFAEKRIAELAEAEANARQSAQKNASAAKRIAGVGVADYMEGSAASNDALKDEDRRNARANRRLQISRDKQARGVKLSRNDQANLDAADRQVNQTDTMNKAKDRDLKEAAAAKTAKENYEKNVAEYQRRTADATEQMRDFLKESVTVQ